MFLAIKPIFVGIALPYKAKLLLRCCNIMLLFLAVFVECTTLFLVTHAKVAELVDALALGASGATCESSSLSFRTIINPLFYNNF